MKLEIVTHCWRYSRLLTYQLSSLALRPPTGLEVRATVYYAQEDEPTRNVLAFFAARSVPRVEWNWCRLPPEKLFRRTIGRNQAALATAADWVWFADADYCFGDGCLDSLPLLLESVAGPLAFPRRVLTNVTHRMGDTAVDALAGEVRVLDVSTTDFSALRMNRAIGGIQIARGDACRSLGYCNGMKHRLRPAKRWGTTFEDVAFRRSLGTRGQPIALPNVFRIRHSTSGRTNPAVAL